MSTNSLTLRQEEENLAENRRLESRSSAVISTGKNQFQEIWFSYLLPAC